MGTFVPGTSAEQDQMLREAGYKNFDSLFADVPEEVRMKDLPEIPSGKSEMETYEDLRGIASRNKVYRTILRGAGAYDHYIPSIVDRIASKETLVTAYTPYQAEMSQGVLQQIFEYQSMICALTGMDVSNASVYDGATAAAEGVMMCLERKRNKILVSGCIDPRIISVIRTYAHGRGAEIEIIPEREGRTDLEQLGTLADSETAAVLLAQPNYFGIIEEAEEAGYIIHAAGAKFVLYCEPISLGLLKTPAALGADIAVGEGQPLGIPLSFGGPFLGYMASKAALMRKLPGRIVGETTDSSGRRAFALTLQAREQHIRREKASSNICSNEALCTLRAAVYMSAVGPQGLREVAVQCSSKAHYLAKKLAEAGLNLAYEKPFFCEFVTEGEKSGEILEALSNNGILGGLSLENGRILWCATEKCIAAELDRAAEIVKEVLR
ncbi:MAG: aminomethyl-transferring glycine dehydrogenase subunit GcvPA [Lachnospiraceae bacterium]|nr:aminomethyl-transferring glycine dehydrogenase subunit GcvPA [Lachnospiraceae bacterium]